MTLRSETSSPAPSFTHQLDTTKLRRFLDPLLDERIDGELQARLIAGGRSNPTYELSDRSRQWILRRPPHGLVLPTAHDMAREHRILTALRPTPVPVPVTIGLSNDVEIIGAQFYVMEKLDGVTLRTQQDSAGLTLNQRASFSQSMIEALATLHEVDVDSVGLTDWGRPDGFLERQLRRWRRQWESSRTSDRPEVDQVLEVLHRAMPVTRFPGIVHGDYKADNVMVSRTDPSTILGLLDWEMSTLGDTLADVGMMVSFWDQIGEQFNPISVGVTALEGFPSRDQIVEEYAHIRGIDMPEIDWYIVLADFKLAVILEGIHARHLHGHTTGDDFEGIGDMVGPLLNRALDRASTTSQFRF